MGLLNVSAAEWAVAEEFFRLNEQATKLKKTSKDHGFSFIKVEGNIYAMANGTHLGEGGFAIVKMVENNHGENFAVKIEGKGIDRRTLKEIDVMKQLGKHIGILERPLGKIKQFWKPTSGKSLLTDKKIYKIVRLEQGKDLFDLLHRNPGTPLTVIQKLIIAIRGCQVLQEIHRQGVIHADIKPDNMLVTVNGNQIALTILDFGFSILLPEGQVTIRDELKGTPGFIAPEIYNSENPRLSKGEYSCASDVYALGMMLKNHFRFTENIYGPMIVADPTLRITLQEMILKLVNILSAQKGLDADAINLIKTFKPDFGTSVQRSLPPIPTQQPADQASHSVPTKQTGQFFKAKLELLLSKAPTAPEKRTSPASPSMTSSSVDIRVSPARPEGLGIPLRMYGGRQSIAPSGLASQLNMELAQKLQTRVKPGVH